MQGTSDMLEVNKLQRSYRRDQEKMEIQREQFFHKKLMEQVSILLMILMVMVNVMNVMMRLLIVL